jgi:hypothetical protein
MICSPPKADDNFFLERYLAHHRESIISQVGIDEYWNHKEQEGRSRSNLKSKS